MKKIRVLLAALLILAMMAPMAMADDDEEGAATTPTAVTQSQTIVGVGSYADPSTADVWAIKLPTAEVVAFTIDPKKLVYKSSLAVGEEEEEENPVEYDSSATMLFANYSSEDDEDGNPVPYLVNYSSELEALKVENQGTTDVVVSLNIRPTRTNMIIEQSSATMDTSSKDPILLFQAKQPDGSYKVVSAVGANFSSEIKAKSSAWNVQGTAQTGFRYVENDDEETGTGSSDFTWNSAAFSIKGEANSNETAKWTSDLTPPNLELTWYVRNKSVEALPVVVSSEIQNGTKYVMAADRMYALPSETVTVYVQPSYADDDAPAGYMVDTDPSDIKTATKNYYTKEVSATSSDFIKFSNGASTYNGMMKYVFNVPGESGFQGFSMQAKSGSSTVDNQILINGAPVIKKVVITASSSD